MKDRRDPNFQLEFPLYTLLILLVLLLWMLASIVYQLLHRRWLPAGITAVVLAGVVYVLMV